MGTSSIKPTPSGAGWSQVKREITRYSKGDVTTTTIRSIMSRTSQALSEEREGTGASGFISGAARQGISRGAYFLETVDGETLLTALEALGITEAANLEGAELLDRISEAIIGGRLTFDQEIATTALRNTLMEILQYSPEDFESAVRLFLEQEGLPGFIEAFLTKYVFETIWGYLEDAARERILREPNIESLVNALEHLCAYEVETVVQESNFETVDWLGQEGLSLVDGIGRRISTDLASLA
jgi:hypothetical protein